MNASRAATVAAWWPWLALPVVATALVSVGLTLSLTDPDGRWVTGEAWVNVPLALGFSTVAAGIWSTRPHPPGLTRLGLLYTCVGLAAALVLPTFGLARSELPGAGLAAWVSSWIWSLGAAPLLGLGLLLYPDGRLPSRRWCPAVAVSLTGMCLLTASAALRPGPLVDHPGYDNPVGVGSRAFWDAAGGAGFAVLMVGAAAGVAALVVRFRAAEPGGDVRRQIRGFALVGALIVVVAPLPDDRPAIVVLGVVVLTALPVTVGAAVLRHALLDQDASLEGLHRRVEALSAARQGIVTEREEERARLRRELHDGLGPSLAAIGLGLRQLEQGDGGGVGVRELADEVQRAVAEVRRICDGLRPTALDELGLAGALTEGVALLERVGPRIELSVGDLPRLSPAVETAAYRIAMEAVTNAVRHAQADRVRVRVEYDDGVAVHVDDDGRGVPGGGTPGVGLRAMAERADELGGSVEVRGSASGTSVRAWLPVAAP